MASKQFIFFIGTFYSLIMGKGMNKFLLLWISLQSSKVFGRRDSATKRERGREERVKGIEKGSVG